MHVRRRAVATLLFWVILVEQANPNKPIQHNFGKLAPRLRVATPHNPDTSCADAFRDIVTCSNGTEGTLG
eukprot:5833543-Amphidinium_carterae.1